MRIQPITLREACAFIAQHHRHNNPPRGHKFSIGLFEDARLVGVACAGRPIARAFDDGLTLEINRTCVDDAPNGNSMLYGACRRVGFGMGYLRIITYTRQDESGSSLKAAGFVKVRELEARRSWADSSVKLKAIRDPVGDGGVGRILWEVKRDA